MFKAEELPSREQTYPTLRKGNSSSKVTAGMGYVTSKICNLGHTRRCFSLGWPIVCQGLPTHQPTWCRYLAHRWENHPGPNRCPAADLFGKSATPWPLFLEIMTSNDALRHWLDHVFFQQFKTHLESLAKKWALNWKGANSITRDSLRFAKAVLPFIPYTWNWTGFFFNKRSTPTMVRPPRKTHKDTQH